MRNFLYIGLIVFGVGMLAYTGTQSQLTPIDLGKYSVMVLAGIGFLISENYSYITGLFKRQAVVTSEKIFLQSDFEVKDMECLYHLQMRCKQAGSKEGMELCSKLNDVMFNLKLDEVKNAKVAS
jgi:hypothetical protein